MFKMLLEILPSSVNLLRNRISFWTQYAVQNNATNLKNITESDCRFRRFWDRLDDIARQGVRIINVKLSENQARVCKAIHEKIVDRYKCANNKFVIYFLRKYVRSVTDGLPLATAYVPERKEIEHKQEGMLSIVRELILKKLRILQTTRVIRETEFLLSENPRWTEDQPEPLRQKRLTSTASNEMSMESRHGD